MLEVNCNATDVMIFTTRWEPSACKTVCEYIGFVKNDLINALLKTDSKYPNKPDCLGDIFLVKASLGKYLKEKC